MRRDRGTYTVLAKGFALILFDPTDDSLALFVVFCLDSPFGKRCCSIHDPRVQGEYDSWLTHTETQGNNSATDINVDALYQKTQHEIHCGTPFGEQFLPEVDSWNELYKRVSNIYYKDNNVPKNNKSWIDNTRRTPSLPAILKLQIAAEMRCDAGFFYKYRPQHIIHGELCMVLQKRAFRIAGKKTNQTLSPISHRQYNPRSHTDIMVHELAFGPDGDSTARPISLWFNLHNKEIVACTEVQAKRFRWKRGLKNAKETRRSPFDHLDNFQMIRPSEKDAFDLSTDILHNRLRMLQAEKIVNLKERSEMLSLVRHEKDQLQQRFDALLRHWLEWGWPVTKGRVKADKNTPVPRIDGKYELPIDGLARVDEDTEWTPCELADDTNKIVMGKETHCVWESFTRCEVRFHHNLIMFILVSRSHVLFCSFYLQVISIEPHPSSPKTSPAVRRLPIFSRLSCGEEIDEDRSLPHIHGDSFYKRKENDGQVPNRQSERCWKALLLHPDQLGFANEWDLVHEHFDKSRTKKVLSIIQQK